MRESQQIDIPSSHYTLGWILDYSKVAQGQAVTCSLLARDDFNTRRRIRQLPQIPAPLQKKNKKNPTKHTQKKNHLPSGASASFKPDNKQLHFETIAQGLLSKMATMRKHIPIWTRELLSFFFWVSDTTFRCFGDNYRKRKIELLAFLCLPVAV